MERESFEDEGTAQIMNAHFINIKIDREERPDLDQIYQSAHQLLTQRGGGWPLTMFLTPDQTPFYAGTYFPKTPRHQLPGFIGLMENVARAWHERRGEVVAQKEAVQAALFVLGPQGENDEEDDEADDEEVSEVEAGESSLRGATPSLVPELSSSESSTLMPITLAS